MKYLPLLLLPVLFLASCRKGETDSSASGGGSTDLGHRVLTGDELAAATTFEHPLAEAYYKTDPDFFQTKTLADLPEDLEWLTGEDEPEIGSPECIKGGTWEAGLTDFPRTLRTRGPDAGGRMRNYLLDWTRIPLVEKHPDTKGYFAALAKEWAVDRDTATMYFKLRPEATWTDGVPITVKDYFFLFYFMRSPWIKEPYAADFFATKHTKIVKYDDHTFSLTAAEKRPDLEDWIVGLYPIPSHYYEDFGEDYVDRYNWGFAPSTGIYSIATEDIKKGKSITLRKVENWWAKDLPRFRYRWNPDAIRLSVTRDPNKAFETFKRGDIDGFRLNLAEYNYDKFSDDHDLVAKGYVHKHKFYQDVPKSGYSLWFNTSKPGLDNIDIRRGLNHAANWQVIIDEFFYGDWNRMNTFSDGFGEISHPNLSAPEFSIEKAEAAFAKAGYTKRGSDGILVNDAGERLSFTISTGYKTLSDLMTIFKEEGAKAGVEFKLEVLESTAGWKKSQEKKHEITLTGFAGSTSEVYPRYWDFFHSDNAIDEDGNPKTNTNNISVFHRPELDPMIATYRASEDHDEKVRLAHQIEEIVAEELPLSLGVYQSFYRIGTWRWVGWPETFNHNQSEIEWHWMVHWIDEAKREETKAAMKEGRTFPVQINSYEQFKR